MEAEDRIFGTSDCYVPRVREYIPTLLMYWRVRARAWRGRRGGRARHSIVRAKSFYLYGLSRAYRRRGRDFGFDFLKRRAAYPASSPSKHFRALLRLARSFSSRRHTWLPMCLCIYVSVYTELHIYSVTRKFASSPARAPAAR